MKNYSTILFDVDDTLVDFKRSEQASLKICYVNFFKHLMDEDVFLRDYNRINHALWHQVEKGEVPAAAVGHLRFRQLADLHQFPFSPDVPHYYEQQLIKNSELIDGAEELLGNLVSRQIKIGFISNGLSHIQRGKYKDLRLSRYTDVLVISEEVGFSKPHSKIFHHALAQLQSTVTETLMVGDSITSDGEGARRISMSFCWYNPLKNPGPEHWEPKHVLHDLKHLISLVSPI